MRIDNPKSKQHFRYQRIVNRVAFAIIMLLVSGLLNALGVEWWLAALAPSLFLILVFGLLFCAAAAFCFLAYALISMIEFFKGNDV